MHELFKRGIVKIITREEKNNGIVLFQLYSEMPKDNSKSWQYGWWRDNPRVKVTNINEIKLAIELAEKYNVKRMRL